MSKIPFFAVFAIIPVIIILFFSKVFLGNPSADIAPSGQCAVLDDNVVTLSFTASDRDEVIVFKEAGYYRRDLSGRIVFKHWQNDFLNARDLRPQNGNKATHWIVSDYMSFQVIVDKACMKTLQTHPVMRWSTRGDYI